MIEARIPVSEYGFSGAGYYFGRPYGDGGTFYNDGGEKEIFYGHGDGCFDSNVEGCVKLDRWMMQ
jgi:hypothetical protein